MEHLRMPVGLDRFTRDTPSLLTSVCCSIGTAEAKSTAAAANGSGVRHIRGANL